MRTSDTKDKLTDGKRLAWNGLLNLGTGGLLTCLTMVFVPMMLRAFGAELYGVLSVTWMVLANFAWLDFGLSRASARYVAQELAQDRPEYAAAWTWTAVVSQTFLGMLGAILLWCLAPTIADHIQVQQDNRDLVILTTRLFAFSIPVDFANRSFTGVLQAAQRFDWVNVLSVFNSFATYGVYGITLVAGGHFRVVTYGLVALRLINLICVYVAAGRVLPQVKSVSALRAVTTGYWSRAKALIKYGCWVATASVIGPVLLYFDQWMLSVILGVRYLPYYTVPTNFLWRLGLFPNSLTSTLFPAFSAMHASDEWERLEGHFVRAHKYLLVALAPLLFLIFVWAPEILRVWLGADFAALASEPMRLLVPGFAIGLLAPLCGAVLEGVGRPDALVKIYAAELPFNVAVVWLATKWFGISGAAASYSIRTIVETVILLVVVYQIVPFSWKLLVRRGLLKPLMAVIPLVVGALWIGNAKLTHWQDIAASALILAIYAAGAYAGVIDGSDRAAAVGLYRGKMSVVRSWVDLRCRVRSEASE